MNRRRGQVNVVGVLMLTALMVGGCNSDPDPVATPTPTPTPTETAAPSPSPTPTELTDEEILEALPPLARQEDFIGAQEFSKFFLTKYHHLMRSEPLLFAALSADSCQFCSAVEDHYSQVNRDDHELFGGHVHVMTQDAQGELQEDGSWRVALEIDVEPLVERDLEGEEVATVGGGPGVATLLLEYDTYWRVLEVAGDQT